ncbi:MAG: sugar-transfer associated ATP-grasp domain-containing protein [Anaerolineae bacterium]
MSRLVNLIYLGYFIKTTDYRRLIRCMRWVHAHHGAGYLSLAGDILACALVSAVSFKEYFLNRFFELDNTARRTFACAGFMHRFTKQMNDRQAREVFRSKARFYQHFGHLMGRECLYLRDSSREVFSDWVANRPLIVAKPNFGARGRGVAFIDTAGKNPDELYSQLLRNRQDFVEEPIKQHHNLHRLNPYSVNTIRVMTINTGTNVDVLGAVLRCSVGGNRVDNMFAGGIGAPLDIATGQVSGRAMTNSLWNPSYDQHPDTHEPVLGFRVPLWDEVIGLARDAAMVVPSVRTVGWDIAVTNTGAVLVESNDNWNVVLWQISTGKGQLEVLRRYADV